MRDQSLATNQNKKTASGCKRKTNVKSRKGKTMGHGGNTTLPGKKQLVPANDQKAPHVTESSSTQINGVKKRKESSQKGKERKCPKNRDPRDWKDSYYLESEYGAKMSSKTGLQSKMGTSYGKKKFFLNTVRPSMSTRENWHR